MSSTPEEEGRAIQERVKAMALDAHGRFNGQMYGRLLSEELVRHHERRLARIRARDIFATQALNGLLLHPEWREATWADLAEMAFKVADAMLAERERKP